MIPKKIHYCWFGGKELPPDAVRCIGSWRKYCPGYEIKEWNESNFDIDSMPYVREAYDARKYAFVADVARLTALDKEGGVYMDTDMELTRGIDRFLDCRSFCGFEDDSNINAAIIGAQPGTPWIAELIDYYRGRHFVRPNGRFDITTVVTIMTRHLQGKGLRTDGSMQELPGIVKAYPKDYFYPKAYDTGRTAITSNTHGIHHCVASWVYQQDPVYISLSRKYHAVPKVIRRHFILTYMGERKSPFTSWLIKLFSKK